MKKISFWIIGVLICTNISILTIFRYHDIMINCESAAMKFPCKKVGLLSKYNFSAYIMTYPRCDQPHTIPPCKVVDKLYVCTSVPNVLVQEQNQPSPHKVCLDAKSSWGICHRGMWLCECAAHHTIPFWDRWQIARAGGALPATTLPEEQGWHGRGRGRLGRVAPVCCPSGRGLACNHLA